MVEAEIEHWLYKLNALEILYTEWKEPDMDNKITAIAILGNEKLFKKLKLIGSTGLVI